MSGFSFEPILTNVTVTTLGRHGEYYITVTHAEWCYTAQQQIASQPIEC